MSIPYVTVEPVEGAYQAYAPLFYQFAWLQNSGGNDPAIEVEVFINGEKFGSSKFPNISQTGQPLGGVDAFAWNFDAQGAAKEFFDHQSFFPEIGAAGTLTDTGWQAELSLRVFLYLPNADGQLVREPDFLETQIIYVINGTANILEPLSLEPYIPGDQLAKHCTNKPDRVLVGFDESEWLPIISFGSTGTQIRTYNFDGTLRGEGVIAHPANAPQNYNFIQIGVGPANINAMQPSDWFYTSGNLTIDENVDFYLVRVGLACEDGSLWAAFENRRYIPREPAGRAYRFHFINGFGGVDSLSVYNWRERAYEVASEQYRRPLPNVIQTDTPGRLKLQSTGENILRGQASNLTPGQADFFKFFVRSPWVIWEDEGKYYVVTLEDQTLETEDPERGLVSIAFEARLSLQDFSQKN